MTPFSTLSSHCPTLPCPVSVPGCPVCHHTCHPPSHLYRCVVCCRRPTGGVGPSLPHWAHLEGRETEGLQQWARLW